MLYWRCRVCVGGHRVGFQRGVQSSGGHGGFGVCVEQEVGKLEDVDGVIYAVRVFSEEVDS